MKSVKFVEILLLLGLTLSAIAQRKQAETLYAGGCEDYMNFDDAAGYIDYNCYPDCGSYDGSQGS